MGTFDARVSIGNAAFGATAITAVPNKLAKKNRVSKSASFDMLIRLRCGHVVAVNNQRVYLTAPPFFPFGSGYAVTDQLPTYSCTTTTLTAFYRAITHCPCNGHQFHCGGYLRKSLVSHNHLV